MKLPKETRNRISLNLIKERIYDIEKQTVYGIINNSNRLETYKRYKHSITFEKYLDNIVENKFRTALTRFRLSSHRLAIETGRFQNLPRDERLCTHCKTIIENEYHFLLTCPLYRDIRLKYLKPYFCRWPTIHKFDQLMSTTSAKCTLNLSKYVYFAMKLKDTAI